MDRACHDEIVALHRFFEDWFNGRVESTDAVFARFRDVLDEHFGIVSPDGRRRGRLELLASLHDAHGGAADEPLSIWITHVDTRPVGGGLILATYEEWHESGGQARGRLSTALFAPAEDTPQGLRWLHVHETWLPGGP